MSAKISRTIVGAFLLGPLFLFFSCGNPYSSAGSGIDQDFHPGAPATNNPSQPAAAPAPGGLSVGGSASLLAGTAGIIDARVTGPSASASTSGSQVDAQIGISQ